MTAIRITREQAAEALRAAAKDGKVRVLWSSAREHTLEVTAIDVLMTQLQYATLIAYQPGPFGFDLSMLLGLTIFHFDVPMPGQSPAEEFLDKHGDTIFDLLENDARPSTEAAYQDLVTYMSNRNEAEGP